MNCPLLLFDCWNPTISLGPCILRCNPNLSKWTRPHRFLFTPTRRQDCLHTAQTLSQDIPHVHCFSPRCRKNRFSLTLFAATVAFPIAIGLTLCFTRSFASCVTHPDGQSFACPQSCLLQMFQHAFGGRVLNRRGYHPNDGEGQLHALQLSKSLPQATHKDQAGA